MPKVTTLCSRRSGMHKNGRDVIYCEEPLLCVLNLGRQEYCSSFLERDSEVLRRRIKLAKARGPGVSKGTVLFEIQEALNFSSHCSMN